MLRKSLAIIVFGFTLVLNMACSEPPAKKDLPGRWLHRTERRGLDFSDEGLLCKYSLAPQKIELYGYDVEDSNLKLSPLVFATDQAETSIPLTIQGKTVQLKSKDIGFESYVFVEPEEGEHPWPSLIGLWQADGSYTDEILLFTRWGTVFGQNRMGSAETSAPFWAKYKLYKDRASGSDNHKKIGLWGLHGESVLGGKQRPIQFQGDRLLFEGRKYMRRTSLSTLSK
jgi:hypothetical protein